MALLSILLLLAIAGNTQADIREVREESMEVEVRTLRPFPKITDTEDDSTRMQVFVVLLVAFCVSLTITVIIRFLRKYSERQRLYSSFN
ncbi:Protein CBG03998 [Caenorhabditis briggsae]|uniref:Protein CBG03998 n=2 Tax=Caenorhabditis briggsae TaxID=6238 RepID=A8WVY4_CAEBR|nr:Protein CBG03998 [Caenorhabditis briggsae]ULU10550.1 hypothetical protein L3Y34_014673 [Caenorhabditis briggsae]CAP24796.1 Protein CBG03998 [Caenorhabditis briggsae]